MSSRFRPFGYPDIAELLLAGIRYNALLTNQNAEGVEKYWVFVLTISELCVFACVYT